jgi:hypothetical protein
VNVDLRRALQREPAGWAANGATATSGDRSRSANREKRPVAETKQEKR